MVHQKSPFYGRSSPIGLSLWRTSQIMAWRLFMSPKNRLGPSPIDILRWEDPLKRIMLRASEYPICFWPQSILFAFDLRVSYLLLTSEYPIHLWPQSILFTFDLRVSYFPLTSESNPICLWPQSILFSFYLRVSYLLLTSEYPICFWPQSILFAFDLRVSYLILRGSDWAKWSKLSNFCFLLKKCLQVWGHYVPNF